MSTVTPHSVGQRGKLAALGVACLALAAFVQATESAARSLDSYPGFARTAEGAVREDAIAYHEAYMRELLKGECMADAGFEYSPDVAFPEEATLGVARFLEVTPVRSAESTASEANAAFVRELRGPDLDAYMQALYGESAADMTKLWQTERLPPGAGPNFASGGCTGEAIKAIPGIWALPRELEPELEAIRADARRVLDPGEAVADYESCAQGLGADGVRGPDRLDELLASSSVTPELAADIRDRCDDGWAMSLREAEASGLQALIARHLVALDAQANRYDDAIPSMTADLAFKSFLAEAAGAAASALNESVGTDSD